MIYLLENYQKYEYLEYKKQGAYLFLAFLERQEAMKRNGICLVLTDRCNAECEICCFSCSPFNKNVMTEELMIETIRQAAELGGVQQIGFSGGEPFLCYDLLKKGLEYAKEKGFSTSIVTNGFWGSWSDETLQEKIAPLPIDLITFSHDAYHAQYVKTEDFVKAIRFGQMCGFQVKWGIGETKGDCSANEFFRSLGDFKYLMDYYMYPFLYAGRAQNLSEEKFFRYCDGKELYCSDDETLAVMYDGRVYPCCSQPVFDTCLYLGNIQEQTLEELLNKSFMADVHKVMSNNQMFTQIGKIAREELGMELPEKCGSPCEICRIIFQKKENMEKLQPYIEKLHGKLITDAFLGHKGGR